MSYLFEALWYSLLIVLKISWLPLLIIVIAVILIRLYGAAKQAKKKK